MWGVNKLLPSLRPGCSLKHHFRLSALGLLFSAEGTVHECSLMTLTRVPCGPLKHTSSTHCSPITRGGRGAFGEVGGLSPPTWKVDCLKTASCWEAGVLLRPVGPQPHPIRLPGESGAYYTVGRSWCGPAGGHIFVKVSWGLFFFFYTFIGV